MAVKIPVETTTVDNEGRKETRTTFAVLVPPPAEACQVCGRNPAHADSQPHDAQSLYYQYAFYGKHGRWPTWKDAIAHCSDPIKQAWERGLRERGAWSE